MQDREEEARRILHRLHSDSSDANHEFATAEMYQIQKQIRIDRTLGNSWMHLFRKRSYLKRVGMACVSIILRMEDQISSLDIHERRSTPRS